jgi:WD40 repeat protein
MSSIGSKETMRNCLRWLAGVGLSFFVCFPFTALAGDSKSRTDRFGDPLPEGAVSRLGTARWRYPSQVVLVRFLENGKQLLVCRRDGIVQILDAATGKEMRRFGFGNAVDCHSAAVSPDGATIALGIYWTPTGFLGNRIHVWNVATGKKTCSFDPEFSILSNLSFIDGNTLIGLNSWRTIKAWDTGTGKVSRVLMDEPRERGVKHDQIQRLVVSPDGSTLAFTSEGEDGMRNLHTSSLKGGKAMASIPIGKYWEIRGDPVFTPDSRFIASCQKDGTIQVYKSPSLEKVRVLTKVAKAQHVSFSPDGRIVGIYDGKAIRVFDFATGKELRVIGEKSVPVANMWPRRIEAWSPDSKRFAQQVGPGTIRVWDTEKDKGTDPGIGHFGPISAIVVSEDGKTAHTLGEDHTIRSWDVQTATEQRRESVPSDANFVHLLGPKQVVLHRKDGKIQIWDLEKKSEFARLETSEKRTCSLSEDGLTLYVTDHQSDSPTAWYDLKTGKNKNLQGLGKSWTKNSEKLKEELKSVTRGTRYVVAKVDDWGHPPPKGFSLTDYPRVFLRFKQSENDSSILWETRLPADSLFEAMAQQVISFTPDDRAILTTDFFNQAETTSISLLESLTGNERCRFAFPTGGLAHAFSKSGDLLAVGTRDGAAVFDIRRGIEIARLNGDQGW